MEETTGREARELKIAYGANVRAKKWSNKTITFKELCGKLETTARTPDTVEEYPKLRKEDREAAKDRGGFVGGALKGGRRQRQNVECRSMLTLDADRAAPDFLKTFENSCPSTSCLYSTHGHTPDAPRFRIIIPLARDVTPDEYNALSRYVAKDLGIDQFDEVSYRPHQLMFWPTTPSNGEYIFKVYDGEWLVPDAVLAAHPEWKDCSQLPTSSRESEARVPTGQKQADPLGKDGIVGAFCRAYTIEDAIDAFLADVYAPSATPGRYDYIPADSSAGVVTYDDKWMYSHHATDPACGMLLNAFDAVRIHKFGDEDEKASFRAMKEFAAADEQVNKLLLEERRENARSAFDDWEKHLKRDKGGLLENSLHNITLILNNDPALQVLVFNQLADGMEIKGEAPWKRPDVRFWREADDAQLISYVDSHFGTFSSANYNIAVTKVTDDRSYHPIKEYLNGLPPWDGIPRVETLLVDYLGADDNAYTRAVTRKTLCAAVARVYHPGLKCDSALVLNGDQGIGKSTLVAKLGMEWYSDSLSISDMNDKTAAEKLQGYWLLEIGELAGMKRADMDKVKAFISRQDDKYRASFGRRVTPHPRQCIFIGTLNSKKGYLRDVTGNRRFWTVKTPGTGPKRSWQLTDEDVGQIWAETTVMVKTGEKLYLDPELEELAQAEQREAMEQDDREGLVLDYLETPLPNTWRKLELADRNRYLGMPFPDNWDEMDLSDRVAHVNNYCDLRDKKKCINLETRTMVSNMDIWVECFRKIKADIQPKDSYEISGIMVRLGWTQSGQYERGLHGKQRVYMRNNL